MFDKPLLHFKLLQYQPKTKIIMVALGTEQQTIPSQETAVEIYIYINRILGELEAPVGQGRVLMCSYHVKNAPKRRSRFYNAWGGLFFLH